MTYDKIKYYYDNGLWDEHRVHKAVERKVITPEQYTEITGQEYK